MIRCAWCGAKNYAIDMWCSRCQHHLDWQPRRSQPARPFRFLSSLAAAAGVALAVAVPASGWSSGSLQLTIRGLPATGLAVQPGLSRPAGSPKVPTKTTPTAGAASVAQRVGAVAAAPRSLAAAPRVGSAPGLAPGQAAADPVGAIQSFYGAVSAHQYTRAASFWSPSMKAAYPPTLFIDNRFSATQQIGLTGDRVLSDQAGSALVYVDVLEVIGGQQRKWVGTWQLVQSSSGWLLNSANLQGG